MAPTSSHVGATLPATPTTTTNLGAMAYGAKACYLGAELRVQKWDFDNQDNKCEILTQKWLKKEKKLA
jgi:hypothetical protein